MRTSTHQLADVMISKRGARSSSCSLTFIVIITVLLSPHRAVSPDSAFQSLLRHGSGLNNDLLHEQPLLPYFHSPTITEGSLSPFTSIHVSQNTVSTSQSHGAIPAFSFKPLTLLRPSPVFSQSLPSLHVTLLIVKHVVRYIVARSACTLLLAVKWTASPPKRDAQGVWHTASRGRLY